MTKGRKKSKAVIMRECWDEQQSMNERSETMRKAIELLEKDLKRMERRHHEKMIKALGDRSKWKVGDRVWWISPANGRVAGAIDKVIPTVYRDKPNGWGKVRFTYMVKKITGVTGRVSKNYLRERPIRERDLVRYAKGAHYGYDR